MACKRSRPAELVPGTAARDLRAHELLARGGAPCRRGAGRSAARLCLALRAGSRLSQGAARRARRGWPQQLRERSARSAIASASTAPRCWRRRWRAMPAWAGSASTPTCIARDAGSWFFLGEILTDLPLPAGRHRPARIAAPAPPASRPARPRPSSRPYQLDARRCISYLTIELHGAIPVELRAAMGNRIYGCDDCQLVCPWNKFARAAAHPDFKVRHGLDARAADGAVRLDRGAVRGAHARLGDLSHRLRALVAQHRRGAGQCAALARGACGAARRAREDASALVREHVRLGAGAARRPRAVA